MTAERMIDLNKYGTARDVNAYIAELEARLAAIESASRELPEVPNGALLPGDPLYVNYVIKLRAAAVALKVENESLRAECGLRQIQGYNEGIEKCAKLLRKLIETCEQDPECFYTEPDTNASIPRNKWIEHYIDGLEFAEQAISAHAKKES